MSSNRSVRAGDPFVAAANRKPERTTRHHRCDEAFIDALEEDFAITRFALSNAFMGVPAEPKKGAIAVAEWAAAQDEPEKALLAWARKNGRGTFRPDDVVGDDE